MKKLLNRYGNKPSKSSNSISAVYNLTIYAIQGHFFQNDNELLYSRTFPKVQAIAPFPWMDA